jgi:WD40 repeat protein
MAWIDGQPLNRAVEASLTDPKQLAQLERRFADLVVELRTLGIAHGDLQHGNILVNRAGELSLVDYDGMFVPALRGLPASETGDANFQHPRRSTQFDADLDRFAAIVIVVALRALIVTPALWRTYNTDDNLLFQRADFADPDRSALFRDLTSEPATRDFAERLRELCRGDYAHVPLLEDFLGTGPSRSTQVAYVEPAAAAVLNRVFGTRAPKRKPRQTRRSPRSSGGARSWKLRRAVAQLAVAFSSDGRFVVAADADHRVWVREATTGRTCYSLHIPLQSGHIGAVALDRRGKMIAAIVQGARIAIWDISDGHWVRELLLTRGVVQSVALSADGRYLALATGTGTLRCWNVTTGSLQGPASSAGGIASVAVSAEGRWMASTGVRSGVQVRELPGGRTVRSLPTGDGVSRVAANGALVAGLTAGGLLQVWNVATGDVQHAVRLTAGNVRDLALAPDGQRVAFVTDDGTVGVRVLNVRGRTAQPDHHHRSHLVTAGLRAPDWLRGVLRRVAAGAVP